MRALRQRGFRQRARAAALDATVELAVSVLRCELGARLEDDANYAGLFAEAQVCIKAAPGISPTESRANRSAVLRTSRSADRI